MQISDAEWDVMEVVWDLGPCVAGDVIKRLRATHDWNHSTIRTLLSRLVEKRALSYDVDGARYIYRAAVSRNQCVQQKGRTFVEQVFAGDVSALLTHFVSATALDAKQIDHLRRLLAEKKSQREKSK